MTMEDVWKDISLASLCDHSSLATAVGSSAARNDPAAVRGFIFQDFMAAASTKLTPSSLAATDLAPPPPTTLLSLSSSGSDHFRQYQGHKSSANTSTNTSAAAPPVLGKLNPQRLQSDSTGRASSSLISFSNKSALDSSPYCKKRAVEEENGENSRHVRHKRMIKNRESASRSRARKQAYTSELELELEHLKEENARLKIQQKKFCLASPVAPARTLKRAHSL